MNPVQKENQQNINQNKSANVSKLIKVIPFNKNLLKYPDILNKQFPISVAGKNLIDPAKRIIISNQKLKILDAKSLKDISLPQNVIKVNQETSNQVTKSDSLSQTVSKTEQKDSFPIKTNNDKLENHDDLKNNDDEEDLHVEVKYDATTGKKTLVFTKKNQIENNTNEIDTNNLAEIKIENEENDLNETDSTPTQQNAENVMDETTLGQNLLLRTQIKGETNYSEKSLKFTPNILEKSSRKNIPPSKPLKFILPKDDSKLKNHFIFDPIFVPVGEKKLSVRRPKTPETLYRKFNLPISYPSKAIQNSTKENDALKNQHRKNIDQSCASTSNSSKIIVLKSQHQTNTTNTTNSSDSQQNHVLLKCNVNNKSSKNKPVNQILFVQNGGKNSNSFRPLVVPVAAPSASQSNKAMKNVTKAETATTSTVETFDEDNTTIDNQTIDKKSTKILCLADHNYSLPPTSPKQQKQFTEQLKNRSVYNLTNELKSKFVPLVGHAVTATIIDHIGMAYSRCRSSHVTALRDLIQYVDNFKKYRQHKNNGNENSEISENDNALSSVVGNSDATIQDTSCTLKETKTVSTQTDSSTEKKCNCLNKIEKESQNKANYEPNLKNVRISINLVSIYREWKNATLADATGYMPIHRAVLENDIEAVERNCIILKKMNTVNILSEYQYMTALHVAVSAETDIEIVKLLLDYGVNPELQDVNGNNCIHVAVRYGATELIELVLKNRKNDPTMINTLNFEGFTPLMLCAEYDQIEIAKLLLQNYANPNVQNPKSGRTVLFQAIEYNNEKLVELLITCGADPKKRDFSGVAPQDAAAELDTQPDIRQMIYKYVSQNIIAQQRKRQRLIEGNIKRSYKQRKIDETSNVES